MVILTDENQSMDDLWAIRQETSTYLQCQLLTSSYLKQALQLMCLLSCLTHQKLGRNFLPPRVFQPLAELNMQ